jgi:GxxExxY protein
VHRELGPGLLESTYQGCLVWELDQRGLGSECQKGVGITCKGVRIDCGHRMDLLVANTVIVELKSVENIDPIHVAQMITYLKLSGHHVGLLINFNVTLLKDGIRRVVLRYPEKTRRSPRPPR